MPIQLEMPKLSDTMTDGTLLGWKVAVGDEVEIGDVIAEIQTDKATMEMEAFDEGTVIELLVNAGDKVPVGTVLGLLAEEGEDTTATTSSAPAATAPAVSAPAAPEAVSQAAAPAAVVNQAGGRIIASPLAKKIAAAKGIDLSTVAGTGPNGRITSADVEQVASGAVAPTASVVSNVASAVTSGTAAGVAASVAAVAASSISKTTPSAAPAVSAKPAVPAAPVAKPAPAAISPVVSGEDIVTPLSGMRKIIAERLLISKQTIPHFYLHVEVDAAPLMALRKQVNAQAEQSHGNKFTFNDFVVKAMINACAKVPAVNSSLKDDSIVQFANVGVSIAIAVEDGLVTPVVKNAQTKSLLAISQEIKEMAVRARDNKLAPNEFDGGTVTISNLGAWGIESFDAIVNPPQASIISVGGIIDKPVVKNGEVVPGKRMNIGMSCDHRVIDGAVAAVYLNEIKSLLESPSLMLI